MSNEMVEIEEAEADLAAYVEHFNKKYTLIGKIDEEVNGRPCVVYVCDGAIMLEYMDINYVGDQKCARMVFEGVPIQVTATSPCTQKGQGIE